MTDDKLIHVTVLPPTLQPAISTSVHLSLTIVCTTLYGCLFFFVYIQLWMILYYRHRHFSYQTVFLFLCLFWAGLRTTLFSFYFQNCALVNSLDTFAYWLLYCCPVCLQFITLCLLVLFFTNVSIHVSQHVICMIHCGHFTTQTTIICHCPVINNSVGYCGKFCTAVFRLRTAVLYRSIPRLDQNI